MKKNTLLMLALVPVAAVALSACADQPRRVSELPPGEYSKSVTTTDANGTTVQKKSSTKVDVDNQGRRKTVSESQVTRDPEGLFNQETLEKSKTVIDDQQ